jgi:hypothetical protein
MVAEVAKNPIALSIYSTIIEWRGHKIDLLDTLSASERIEVCVASYSKVVRSLAGNGLSEGDKDILAETLYELAKDVTLLHERIIFARVCMCICSGEPRLRSSATFIESDSRQPSIDILTTLLVPLFW